MTFRATPHAKCQIADNAYTFALACESGDAATVDEDLTKLGLDPDLCLPKGKDVRGVFRRHRRVW